MGSENDAEPIVAALQAAWAAAFAARDIGALVALYAEDALFFGSTAPLYRGRGGVRTYFATLRTDIVLEEFERFESRMHSDALIVAAGYWRFRFGAQTRPFRLTWTLIPENGQWKIATHHASPRA